MAAQILDDTNPTLIYSSGWHQTLANPGAFNSTLTSSSRAGSGLRINFREVVGNSATLSVFGAVGPTNTGMNPPRSAFSLDGRRFEYFNGSETDSFQYNQRFYLSPSLANGSHSLTVTNLISSGVLYLDYILIAPVNNASSVTSSLVYSGSTPGPTPTTSSVGTMNGSTSRRTTIVASVLGTIVVILVLFGVIWFRQRNKRKSKEQGISSYGQILPSIANSQGLPHEAAHRLLRNIYPSKLACNSSNQASQGTSQAPVDPSTSGQPHQSPYDSSHQLGQVEAEHDLSSPPEYDCDPPTYIPGLPSDSPASLPNGLLPSKLRNDLNQGHDTSTTGGG